MKNIKIYKKYNKSYTVDYMWTILISTTSGYKNVSKSIIFNYKHLKQTSFIHFRLLKHIFSFVYISTSRLRIYPPDCSECLWIAEDRNFNRLLFFYRKKRKIHNANNVYIENKYEHNPKFVFYLSGCSSEQRDSRVYWTMWKIHL